MHDQPKRIGRPPATLQPDDQQELRYSGLLPPANLRSTTPRCCDTCKLGAYDGQGAFICRRPDGPIFDVTDKGQHTHVCDRWRRFRPGDDT